MATMFNLQGALKRRQPYGNEGDMMSQQTQRYGNQAMQTSAGMPEPTVMTSMGQLSQGSQRQSNRWSNGNTDTGMAPNTQFGTQTGQQRQGNRWPDMPTGPDIYAHDYNQGTPSMSQQQTPRQMAPEMQVPAQQAPERRQQQKRGAWDWAGEKGEELGNKFGGIAGGAIGGFAGGPGGAAVGREVGGALGPSIGKFIGGAVKKVGGWLSRVPILGKITDGIGNIFGGLFGGKKKKQTSRTGNIMYKQLRQSRMNQAQTPPMYN